MDESFVFKMFNELFTQYNNIDAVAEYIGIHQECSEYMVRSGELPTA